jgi:hypothetical protein
MEARGHIASSFASDVTGVNEAEPTECERLAFRSNDAPPAGLIVMRIEESSSYAI